MSSDGGVNAIAKRCNYVSVPGAVATGSRVNSQTSDSDHYQIGPSRKQLPDNRVNVDFSRVEKGNSVMFIPAKDQRQLGPAEDYPVDRFTRFHLIDNREQ